MFSEVPVSYLSATTKGLKMFWRHFGSFFRPFLAFFVPFFRAELKVTDLR